MNIVTPKGAIIRPVRVFVFYFVFIFVFIEDLLCHDAGHLPRIIPVVHCRPRIDAEVGHQLISGFRSLRQEIPVPNGLVADVALQRDALRAADFIHPGHGLVDRAGRDIGGRCPRLGIVGSGDLPGQVEVDRAVSHPPPLAELLEFHALHLEYYESLASDDMTAEVPPCAAIIRRWERLI